MRAMIQRDLEASAPRVRMLGAWRGDDAAGRTSSTRRDAEAGGRRRCRSTASPCATPTASTRLDNLTLIVNRGEIVGVAGVEGNGQSELGSGALRHAAADRRPLLSSAAPISPAPAPQALTAAGRRHRARGPPRGGLHHRHDAWPRTCCSTGSTASRRFGLLDRGALTRAAPKQMTRVRRARRRPRGRLLRPLRRQPAEGGAGARADARAGLVFLLAAQPTRGLDVGAVEAVYGQIRAACARGVGVLLISSELDELLRRRRPHRRALPRPADGHCPAEPASAARIGALMAGQPHDAALGAAPCRHRRRRAGIAGAGASPSSARWSSACC